MLDAGDEAVTTTRDRLQIVCAGRIAAQHLAQGGNLNLKVVLLHHHAWPDCGQELVLGRDLTLPLDQGQKQIESARAEVDDLPVQQELPPPGLDMERTKAEGLRIAHRGQSLGQVYYVIGPADCGTRRLF